MNLRHLKKKDEFAMADIIRKVMTSFGCVGEGYSILDPEVDHLFETYQQPGAAFWVICNGNHVLGGGGFAALEGGDKTVCELKKMYFLPELRGQGWGHRLMDIILEHAALMNYHTIYLETVQRMEAANHLYKKHGFLPLPAPMGNTGHHGCDAFYARRL